MILPDARGLTQVDHLVRLPCGIAVLETKALSGFITGAADWQQWTQHMQHGLSRRAFAFQNPLRQNFRHTEAVGLLTGPGVPVHGLVVAAGMAVFCPDLEGVVVHLADLPPRLVGLRPATCNHARLDAAWRRLQAAAAESSPVLREAHLQVVRRRRAAST